MAQKMLFIIAVIASIVAMEIAARADVPRLISFQGKLYNNVGQPLTGPYLITFRIYDAESGGSTLWSEVKSVTCDNGLYSVILGQVTPLTIDFNGHYWLGVQVTGDDELTPRYRLVSVPTAIRAQVADSADRVDWDNLTGVPSGFADGVDDVGATGGVSQINAGTGITVTNPTGPTATVAANIGSGATQVAAGNHSHSSLNAADGNPTNAVYVDQAGNVGIGTTDPGQPLDVNGRIRIRPAAAVNAGLWLTNTLDQEEWFIGKTNLKDKNQFGIYKDDWRMVVESTGNIGVGTTNPLGKQHVRGTDLSLSASALQSDEYILEDTDAVMGLYSSASGNAGSAIALGEVTGGALTDKWAFARETAGGGKGLRVTYGANKDQFSNTAVMYLNDNGDVGIGTISPGARLQVNGDLKVTGAYKGTISSSSGSDGAPFPRPAYDSGWVAIDTAETKTLTHSIGGDVDDYVVDLQFYDDEPYYGRNGRYIGGEIQYLASQDTQSFWGAYWRALTNQSIKVYRQTDDIFADQIRVRIWVY